MYKQHPPCHFFGETFLPSLLYFANPEVLSEHCTCVPDMLLKNRALAFRAHWKPLEGDLWLFYLYHNTK
jgi:hypothetical protein